jgi:hypothetical protein
MARHFAGIVPVLLTGLLLAGCGDPMFPFGDPTPPTAVNAVLPKDLPIYNEKAVETSGPSIAVVVATVRAQDEFAKRTQGNWETHWYVVTLDVVAVERGRWDPKELRFVVKDHWPTPESGILLGKQVWPYRKGVRLAFTLDTSAVPATILGHQERRETSERLLRDPPRDDIKG